MTVCGYCDHTASWHDTPGCLWTVRTPHGSITCDCTHYTAPCDVCDGHGCADCNT